VTSKTASVRITPAEGPAGAKSAALVLKGDVEIAHVRELHQSALDLAMDLGRQQYSVDLSQAGPVHASALQVLVALQNEMTHTGRALKIQGVSGALREQWNQLGFQPSGWGA